MLKPLVEKIIREKYNKKDVIEEGWKEIALGAALLLGASFTGNKVSAQKAKEAINNTEVLGKIKSTLENEEGINKLSNFLNISPTDLNNYMMKNADKLENDFQTAAKKKNMNLKLDVKNSKTKTKTLSNLKQGYSVSDITIYKDTIVEVGDVVMIQDTIELNYSNDNMFITASDELKPEIVRDIQNTLNNINSIGARIVSTNIESSTDQEPINIGNEQLAKNRANSVVNLLDSIGVNPPITTKILPNQGPNLYSTTMSSKERQEARKNTAEYRYVKITFIIVLNETVNTPEPLYKVNERVEVKLVKSNLHKKPGVISVGGKGKKEKGKMKCIKIKKKKTGKTTNCSFIN
jgi:outer membrane protein OmpA-like peptidoglycan-associated protein